MHILKFPPGQMAFVALKQIAFRVIPAALLYRLWHINTRRKSRYFGRNLTGHRKFDIQEGVELHVAWIKVRNVGTGPTASLFVFGEEVLRLDCFGGEMGHMHINPEQYRLVMMHGTPRIYLKPGEMAEHVERAGFELEANTQAALLSNNVGRIRNFRVDPENLRVASGKMTGHMKELIAEYG